MIHAEDNHKIQPQELKKICTTNINTSHREQQKLKTGYKFAKVTESMKNFKFLDLLRIHIFHLLGVVYEERKACNCNRRLMSDGAMDQMEGSLELCDELHH